MTNRIDVYVDGRYVGTHTNSSIALDTLLNEIEAVCDGEGFDYPTVNEELLLETIEDVLNYGGEEEITVDNTIFGIDTGEYAEFRIELIGGIDMY